MSEPATQPGRALLDWMEYIRDPEHYQPGNVGRGPFWDEDAPLVRRVEAAAASAALDKVKAAVEGLPSPAPRLNPTHWAINPENCISRAAVLAAIAAERAR